MLSLFSTLKDALCQNVGEANVHQMRVCNHISIRYLLYHLMPTLCKACVHTVYVCKACKGHFQESTTFSMPQSLWLYMLPGEILGALVVVVVMPILTYRRIPESLVAQCLNCSTVMRTLLMIWVQSRVQVAGSRLTQASIIPRSVNWGGSNV